MGDSFSELIVPKRQSFGARFLQMLIKAMTIASAIFMFLTFSPIFLITFFVCFLLWYFLVPRLSVEYEYSYVNGDLDIAAVFSKKSRKHLATLQLTNAECIAPLGSHELDSYGDTYKVVNYSSGNPNAGEKTYVMIKPDTREKILLHLDQTMLEDLKYRMPRKVTI